MDNFIVSARKYRPVIFESVVGQKSITTTLKNAISSNHLAQAYLFCGPRGVGKTTCARIFAKTINCKELTSEVEACDKCESCISFNQSRSYNIHELDAASNNSVEDIRNLIDQVRIPPQVGKYSIYIIDEVHMLSAQAFNAFLKTLEEPPKHAIFILATTEKHKIIPTILSRCQIFDFNRIKVDDIVGYLEFISVQEGVKYEADALNVIAQKADGAMRDALSIYDQIVSYSGNQLTYKKVIENLNLLDYDYYFKLTDNFLASDVSGTLLIYNEILDKGFDSQNFITGLAGHLRDLLVCRDTATIQLLEVGAGIREKYKEQSAHCPQDFLYEALNICNTADINFKTSRNQRLHVELTLIKLCRIVESKKKTTEVITSPYGQALSGKQKNDLPEKQSNPENTVAEASPEKIIKPKAPEPVNEPQKEPVIEKPVYNSITSIKESLKKNENSTDDVYENTDVGEQNGQELTDVKVSENERNITINQSTLKEKLEDFIAGLKEDKPRMYNTLNNQVPEFVDNSIIKLEMSNNSQLEDFNREIKPDMLRFIRNALNSKQVKIETFVNEQENEKLLYTAEERFKYMSEKNPSLIKLKQQFNLDFE